ncbi:MAG: hypothetical protein ACP5IE_09045 [Infirmifilum sp.]
MPYPKYVVALGTCACSGGIFADCYNVLGGAGEVAPWTSRSRGVLPVHARF